VMPFARELPRSCRPLFQIECSTSRVRQLSALFFSIAGLSLYSSSSPLSFSPRKTFWSYAFYAVFLVLPNSLNEDLLVVSFPGFPTSVCSNLLPNFCWSLEVPGWLTSARSFFCQEGRNSLHHFSPCHSLPPCEWP